MINRTILKWISVGSIRHRQTLTSLSFICLLTLCAFFPTFDNDFQMGWDDQWMVYNPMTKGHLDWSLIKNIFTTSFNGQWGPLNQLAYTLIFQITAYSSFAYHVYSFILHIANVCMVYLLVDKCFQDSPLYVILFGSRLCVNGLS